MTNSACCMIGGAFTAISGREHLGHSGSPIRCALRGQTTERATGAGAGLVFPSQRFSHGSLGIVNFGLPLSEGFFLLERFARPVPRERTQVAFGALPACRR